MSTVNSHEAEQVIAKLQIKAFEKGDVSPFEQLDFSKTNVYELIDYTMRTPLEKMDVFSEMLELPHDCKLWVLPVTEETSALLRDIREGDEKTASLFKMLSTFKDTVERDRSFIVAEGEVCSGVVEKLEELGFTLKKMNEHDLKNIELL